MEFTEEQKRCSSFTSECPVPFLHILNFRAMKTMCGTCWRCLTRNLAEKERPTWGREFQKPSLTKMLCKGWGGSRMFLTADACHAVAA